MHEDGTGYWRPSVVMEAWKITVVIINYLKGVKLSQGQKKTNLQVLSDKVQFCDESITSGKSASQQSQSARLVAIDTN